MWSDLSKWMIRILGVLLGVIVFLPVFYGSIGDEVYVTSLRSAPLGILALILFAAAVILTVPGLNRSASVASVIGCVTWTAALFTKYRDFAAKFTDMGGSGNKIYFMGWAYVGLIAALGLLTFVGLSFALGSRDS
ncbi:MAG: hypothetical protein J5685_05330 [Clostridiales bacterium]|nr:hypothetical protein [Clostridiales bacterium]